RVSPGSALMSVCSTSSGPPSPRRETPASPPSNPGGGGGAEGGSRPGPPGLAREGSGEEEPGEKPHHRGSGVAEPARRTAYARLSGQHRAQAARNPRLGGHSPPSGLLLSREAGPTRPLAAGSKRGRLLRPGTATLRRHKIGPGRTSRR